ncbi:HCF173 [Scenedesmus sp. PABB004]|nr:HCF173 [Scenedesmus sp. PABB004]
MATTAPAPAPVPSSGAAAAALAIFCAVVAATLGLVLRPVSLPLPRTARRLRLHYAAAPPAGVALMLATGALDWRGLAAGIVGDDSLQPYAIVIIFMALAYVSTSVDATGCFAWLALHVTRLSRGRGHVLFLLYFGIASLITVFTSNDIAIMTLTPIICYCAAATGADAVPFLAASFTAANVWSMLLFVGAAPRGRGRGAGNPTNIIVATAYRMGFADYSRWMALPTLAAGLACLCALLAEHLRRVPARLALPALAPGAMLTDAPGAALGAANILGCLALLAAAPSLGWELWPVTLVSAGLQAAYNFVAYVAFRGRWCRAPAPAAAEAVAAAAAAGDGAGRGGKDAAPGLELAQQQQQRQQRGRQEPPSAAGEPCRGEPALWPAAPAAAAPGSEAADVQVDVSGGSASGSLQRPAVKHGGAAAAGAGPSGQPPPAPPEPAASGAELLAAVQRPGFLRVWAALPWEVVPFVLGMFVLCEGLDATGWVGALAARLAAGLGGSVWASLCGVGALGVVLSNLMNNQPATILLTRVTLSAAFVRGAAAPRAPLAAGLAVVVASNTAANFTVMGSLAGVMFIHILRRHGVPGVGHAAFTRLMAPSGAAAAAAALALPAQQPIRSPLAAGSGVMRSRCLCQRGAAAGARVPAVPLVVARPRGRCRPLRAAGGPEERQGASDKELADKFFAPPGKQPQPRPASPAQQQQPGGGAGAANPLDAVNPYALGRQARRAFDDVWGQLSSITAPTKSYVFDDVLDPSLQLEADPVAARTKVLVVGATGRVGRILIRKLLLRGYKVAALVRTREGIRDSEGAAEGLPSAVEIVTGDVGELRDCQRAVRGVDKIIFCAAARTAFTGDLVRVDERGVARLAAALQDEQWRRAKAGGRKYSPAAKREVADFSKVYHQLKWDIDFVGVQGEDGSVKRDAERANLAAAEITDGDNLVFSGALFSRGAFAEVGADLNPLLPGGDERLAGTEGLTLRVKSEGHTYACVLRTAEGHSYAARFPTRPARYSTVRLPWALFRPEAEGQPPLTPGAIKHLEVDWIKALPAGAEPDFVLVSCSGAGRGGVPADELARIVAAKRRGEDLLRSTGLGYTIIRPGPLVDEPGGYKALVFDQGDRVGQSVSAADVADICLRALHEGEARNKTFDVCYEYQPEQGLELYELVASIPSAGRNYLASALGPLQRNT